MADPHVRGTIEAVERHLLVDGCAVRYDMRSGEDGLTGLAGNFPQAFSHVGLVNSAHSLSRAEKPARQRSGS